MNSKAGDVTIVIPAKNEAETLPALLSAIQSKLPEFKVLVVDDGSTD
ncbi:MAG: glycosyltransferase, partial [Gammaproteobacteria bacterium]|nr:glycosyltransferase [Gammaproteobacteria bacterium]